MAINSPLGENSVFDPSFEWQGDANRDQSKYLLIEYVSAELNTINIQGGIKTVTLEFKVTGSNLNSRNATFQLYSLQNNYFKKPYKVYTAAINNNGSRTITISIPQILLIEQDLKFEVIVTCDGISSTTGPFSLTGTGSEKSAIPPSKCFGKNQNWTVSDLKYIVSELRKRDAILFQSQYDHGNPIYVDGTGKKYYNLNKTDAQARGLTKYAITTSLYDRDDDEDKKPLKDRIFFYKSDGYNIASNQANYETFTKLLNEIFKKYDINTCLRRIHFLAQVYVETNRFRTTYEAKPKNTYYGGVFYRGRGLKQITHDYNYLDYYCYSTKDKKQQKLFDLYMKHRNGTDESVTSFNKRTSNEYISKEDMDKVNVLAIKISTDLSYACHAAGWYWSENKINDYADKDNIIAVSAKVNNPAAAANSTPDGINSFKERKQYYELLKVIFNYDECK